MDDKDSTQSKEDELKRREPDFTPGDTPPEKGAGAVVMGGHEKTPESSSPEGDVSQTSDASRRP